MKKDVFSSYHPFLNLVFFCGAIGITVFVQHPAVLAISLVSGVVYSGILGGSGHKLRRRICCSVPFIVLLALLNPLFSHYGVTVLGYLPNGNPFTLESCVYGAVTALMLFGVLNWFFCFTEIMTTDKLVYLFGRLIPSLSLVLSMCLRFVPRFARQLRVIADGQKCVGRSPSEGTLTERVRHGISIFSILITWALENAVETAESMKCRGYGGRGRTAFSIYRFDRRDMICLAALCGTLGISLAGIFMGFAKAVYNPVIEIASPIESTGHLVLYLSFVVFCLIPVFLETAGRRRWKRLTNNIGTACGGYRLWEI